MKKTVFMKTLIVLLAGILALKFNVQPTKASGTIYIRADGSLDPPTAPINRVGIVYTFTANIYEPIVVERNNVIIDGNGYISQGLGADRGFDLSDRNNVTIKNVDISAFLTGIRLGNSSNNTIVGNNVTNNTSGIVLWGDCYNNTIIDNTIRNSEWEGIYLREATNNVVARNKLTNNGQGIHLYSSDSNKIFHNDFINNAKQVDIEWHENKWDEGYPSGGNYWSDYTGVDTKIGPNQDELGSDGIGDTPYTININNRDGYPLMKPWTPPSEHELVMSLEAQTLLKPGDSTLINATVINMGLSNETNVELFLLVNGSIVDSNTIPLLANGSADTISHLWTSATEGKYNVTAYSPPVPLETSIKNNQVTVFVIVTTAKRVPYDYPTIQAAINTANPGDIIVVASGTYGSVVVNKAITLLGENRNTTIIEGGDTGYIVTVTADNVVISGFTIRGGDSAIRLINSDNSLIKGNILTGTGIGLEYSSGNQISQNIVMGSDRLYEGGGIVLYYSSNNRLSGNTLTGLYSGIIIDTSGNIVVVGNTIANNKRGIHHLPISNPPSSSKFYHNNFINNTEQIYLQVSIENSWDNGYPSGGNYWSDYTGQDSDGDGIGDTPYTIDERNKDRYPLVKPYDITQEEPTPAPEAINIVPYAIAGVAGIFVVAGLLVYFIKIRKRKQPQFLQFATFLR